MPMENVSDAVGLIRAWIDQRAITEGIETIPTPSGVSFQFTGRDGTGIPFTIIQPDVWKKTLLVVSEVRITEERNKSIESMRPKDRDEFLNNLHKDISFAPAPFAYGPAFENTGAPKGIQFSKEICYDGLTENTLNDAVRDVVRCVIFVIWRIRKEFGEPTPAE